MASTNISLRVSDDERKSLDERAKRAGKDNRSEFILSQINLFDEDEYAWLCDQAKEQLVSVEELIRQLVRIGFHTAAGKASQQNEQEAITLSQTDMLAQILSLLTAKATDPELDEAERFSSTVIARYPTLMQLADAQSNHVSDGQEDTQNGD